MGKVSTTTLIALVGKGATISIDSSDYILSSLYSIIQAAKVGNGHVILRNSSSKTHTSLLAVANECVTFVF